SVALAAATVLSSSRWQVTLAESMSPTRRFFNSPTLSPPAPKASSACPILFLRSVTSLSLVCSMVILILSVPVLMELFTTSGFLRISQCHRSDPAHTNLALLGWTRKRHNCSLTKLVKLFGQRPTPSFGSHWQNQQTEQVDQSDRASRASVTAQPTHQDTR